MFWPSFNAVLVEGSPRYRAILNTYYAMAASCVTSYAFSSLLTKGSRVSMVSAISHRPVLDSELLLINNCRFILYSLSLVLLLNIQKYKFARESEKSHLQQYTVLSSAKLKRHLGIFIFILRLGVHKLNTLSLLSAAIANPNMVYYII